MVLPGKPLRARILAFFALALGCLVVFSPIQRLFQQDFPLRITTLIDHYNRTSNDLLDGFRVLESSLFELDTRLKHSENQRDIAFKQHLNATEARLQSMEADVKSLQTVTQIFKQQLSLSVQFLPLKDVNPSKQGTEDDHIWHYFMSVLRGRGWAEGAPEFFSIPSAVSQGRLLCLKGNDTSHGENNLYAFAFKDGLPIDSVLLPGTTLISDTSWDYQNPWHSMFNLLQFVRWRMDNQCAIAARLLLFHKGEYRKEMCNWISRAFEATGLPWTAEFPSDGERAVCFEKALVSRAGIGGTRRELLREMFAEARCQVRRNCNISTVIRHDVSGKQAINVTLIVREGGRGFIDEASWQEVVKQQCEKVEAGCRWSTMYVSKLTFCQQVEAMSYTDILVSAHGAQLTNIIFMQPGGRVMELFPAGWLELAGHGQYIYRNLASWVGLQHEGYWRDPNTPKCSDANDKPSCFIHYKDQPLGINTTHIGNWLSEVIANFRQIMISSQYSLLPPASSSPMINYSDSSDMKCCCSTS